jgi:hypothetical protein
MNPAQYFDTFVQPTYREYLRNTGDIRLALLACMVAFHYADAKAKHHGCVVKVCKQEIIDACPGFSHVEGACLSAKHIVVTQNANHLGKTVSDYQTHTGEAFSDHTLFNDGTGFADDDVSHQDRIGIMYGPKNISITSSLKSVIKYLSNDSNQYR